jgi:histidyl-tRNA synthetase
VLHCASANGGGSFKAQMKRADGSGAAFAVIIGEDEVKAGTATVKHLREAPAGEGTEARSNQSNLAFDGVVDYIVDQIVGDHDHDHGHDHEHVHYHP